MVRRRALSVALAVLLVASAVVSSGGVALVAATPGNGNGQGGPPDHAVPEGNVQIGNGNGQGVGLKSLPDRVPAHAAAWDVHSSAHAESLEVHIDDPREGRFRIALTDDVNHAGRAVAVNASALEQALGFRPREADGLHENGTTWTSPIEYEDGMATWTVPGFSTNVVIFGGDAILSGDPSINGAQYVYENRLDTVENFNINLTGHPVGEWDNESFASLSDGETALLEVAGNLPPGGPDGVPVAAFTGTGTLFAETRTGAGTTDGGSATFSVGGDDTPQNQQITFDGVQRTGSRYTPSGTGLSNGQTGTFTAEGNLAPSGPSSGQPRVTFTGNEQTTAKSSSGLAWDGTTTSVDSGGNIAPTGAELSITAQTEYTEYEGTNDGNKRLFGKSRDGWKRQSETLYENPPDKITGLRLHVTSAKYLDGDESVEIYIEEGSSMNGNKTEGTLVKTWNPPTSSGTYEIDIQNYSVQNTDAITVTYRLNGGWRDKEGIFVDGSDKSKTHWHWNAGSWNLGPNVELLSSADSVSATVDGTTYDYGSMSDGQTATKSVSLSHGTNNVDFSVSGGARLDYDLSWTARTATEDPSVDVDGDGTADASYSGKIAPGASETVNLSGLATGSNTLEFSMANSHMATDWTVDYDRVEWTEDPAVDLDGDGSVEVSHAGEIAPGATVTYNLSELSLSTTNLTASTANGTTTDLEVRFRERVETRDPVVEVNGVSYRHDGALAEGETVTLDGNPDDVRNGTNRVNVSVGDGTLSSDAPTPAVGLDYSHTTRDDVTVEYAGETWSERYDVTRTWGDSLDNATLEIPFDGNVVAIRDLTVWINGTETPPTWSHVRENSTTLVVGFGDLEANATTRVVSNGSKVVAHNGSIDVLEPTAAGDGLDTKIELESWNGDSSIEVSGTRDGNWIHYTTSESWDQPAEYATVTASGGQTLHLPNAVAGSTTRVETVPLEVRPRSGAVEVALEDPAKPRVVLREGNASGADTVDVTYSSSNLLTGEDYRLFSETRDYEVMTDTYDGSVTFAASDLGEVYIIEEAPASSSGPAVSVGGDEGDGEGGDDDGGATPFALAVLIFGIVVAILVFAYVGRNYLGARGWKQNSLLLVGGGIVGFVGVEAVTGRSVTTDLTFALGDAVGGIASTGIGAVALSVAAFLALYRFDKWTGWVPRWGYVVTGLALAFWAGQVLTDGALSSGVETVSPLLIILGVLIAGAVLWRAAKPYVIQIQGGNGGGSA